MVGIKNRNIVKIKTKNYFETKQNVIKKFIILEREKNIFGVFMITHHTFFLNKFFKLGVVIDTECILKKSC